MITYEVNLEVDEAVADDYLRWLRDHVDEMLELPGFVDASIESAQPLPARADGRRRWCCRYRLETRDALERYFVEHAPRMRGDGLQRFEGRFAATRRILEAQEIAP